MNRRRVISIILLMIFVLSSILPTVKGYAATDGSITLNSALYAAVKSNLEQQSIQASYNDMQHTITISDAEIAKVTKLTLSNNSITDLSGLERFSSVTSLDLSANELNDESDLSILNSFNLTFLDLSSNQISDVSAVTNIKQIATVNLHNQILDKVEVIDNSIVKNGTYEYQCQLPQIVREFAKPLKSDWVDFVYEEGNSAALKFNVSSFNANGDSIGLTIGSTGSKYTGLASLKIKITDMNNRLYNSEINVHYVVINGDQRAIFLKDKKLYEAVKEQLTRNQNKNSDLIKYTDTANLYDKAYDKQQILVINENDLINKITSLLLSNKQITDLSGLEMFVGLQKSLDVSSNYIKTIDTIVALQKMKDEEEAKLQARFKEKMQQLQTRLADYEAAKAELEAAKKEIANIDKQIEAAEKEEASEQTAKKIQNLQEQKAKVQEEKLAPAQAKVDKLLPKVNTKVKEIYTIYNDAYKVTSLITPSLKNMTDEEYQKLSLEQAKSLLQEQITKMTSIEKYFTKEEKAYLTAGYGLDFSDETKNPVAEYFTERLKEIEEQLDGPSVDAYKEELKKLRDFDAFVNVSNSCLMRCIAEDGATGCMVSSSITSDIELKTIDGENVDSITMLEAQKDDHEKECPYRTKVPMEEYPENIIAMAGRIAKATDADISAYVILPRLYNLNMSENLIENIDEISVMKELRTLKMANNEISNINNVNWAEISYLNTLDLAFNNISEIKVLENIKRLKELNLAKNLISGSLDFTINNIGRLQKLDLSENQIDDIENFKNQFEFIAKEQNKTINQYVKDVISKKISLKKQNLSMNIKVQKNGDRAKVELPKIFRQLEEIDWENTSFGISSLYGNVASDGTYVILETPTIGTRIATVTVIGGLGANTDCAIQYEITNDAGNSGNTGDGNKEDDNKDNVQINVNIGSGSSVEATKKVNNMSYVIVSKDTKVADLLKDVTLNTNAYSIVVKDAAGQNTVGSNDILKTNQTIIISGLSNNVQCRIVVKGDVTGNGEVALGDIIKLNQHRLDNSQKLSDAEFLAGNFIDTDEEITMGDIIELNQYRLNNQ